MVKACTKKKEVVSGVPPCREEKGVYLWEELVLLGDLVEHFMGLNGWFQVSSQNLGEKPQSLLCSSEPSVGWRPGGSLS